jgi:acyl carrier protein
MVPAVFVFVEELPTKAGGKIDEARLRKLLFAERLPSHGSSDDDILLAAMTDVWRAVLDVDVLPPDADFFAFGGHSLLATKLVARIRHEFGVALPVVRIFELRTLRKITAALFADAGAPDLCDPAPDALHRSALDRLTANHNQLRAWNVCSAGQPTHFGVAFDLRVPVGSNEIVAAAAALLETHPILGWRFDDDAELTDGAPERPLARLHASEPGHDIRARLHMPLTGGDGVFALDAFEQGGSVRRIVVRARSDFLDGASLQHIFAAILAQIGRESDRRGPPTRYPSRHEWRDSVARTRATLPGARDPETNGGADARRVTTKLVLNRDETARLERVGQSWGVTTPALLMGVLARQALGDRAVLHVDCATDGRLRERDPDYFPLGPYSEDLRLRFVGDELDDVRDFAERAADQLMSALREAPSRIAERSLRPAPVAFSYRFGSGTEHDRLSHQVQAVQSFAPHWHPIKLSCFRGADGLQLVLQAPDLLGPVLAFEAALREVLG